jgi:hypothetical protein
MTGQFLLITSFLKNIKTRVMFDVLVSLRKHRHKICSQLLFHQMPPQRDCSSGENFINIAGSYSILAESVKPVCFY